MSNIPVTVSRLTFDDEFNTFSNSPSGSTGTWATSYPYGGEAARTLSGNKEAEYYSDSSVGENPFSLANGVLTISATPAAPGSNPYNLPYDSGVITTANSFSQTYGLFEVNAKLPAGQGLWPAFWMLPASINYTSELDIFEQVDNNPTTLYSTVHGSTNGTWGADSQALSVPNTSTGFNTFAVDWEPTTCTFYVDGVKIGSEATPTSMNDPMFMILNLAVGANGSWPGAPNGSTIFPANMQIDWVRAYATANTTYVGGSAAIPAGSAQSNPDQYQNGSSSTSSGGSSSSSSSSTAVPVTVTVGSGTDTLALSIAEDAWQGDAQFTISVDGAQIGGTQTATASHAAGQTQTFNVLGNFAAGPHTVSVNFLNDAYGGSATTDRNLYVTGSTIDGSTVTAGTLALMSTGAQSFQFTEAAKPPSVVTIGSGKDTLALSVAEDAWQGDAQFTVSVDGTQVGGTQTAAASHAAGQTQTFDVLGNFAAGSHTVSVDFLNDAYGGTSTTDRNLYVTGSTIDGAAVPAGTLTLMSAGTQSLKFTEAAAAPAPDTLSLKMSEDAWNGDAQYTVSIDGTQIGGVRTATASHAAGASQTVALTGNWGSGPHTVSIAFINDAYGGSPSADRNLYVDGVTYDGINSVQGSASLYSAGTSTFDIAGAEKLTVNLAEDAYQGNAQYSIAIDGKQLGSNGTVTALNSAGQTQAATATAQLTAGMHELSVSFLNDAYGGSAATDRNLYVKSIDLNGTAISGGAAALMSTGTSNFEVYVPGK